MDECIKAANKFIDYKVATNSREKYRTTFVNGDDVQFVFRENK